MTSQTMVIGPSSLISLSFALFAIGGGSMWLASLHSEVQHAKDKIAEVEKSTDKIDTNLHEIAERLSSIEGQLKRISKEN